MRLLAASLCCVAAFEHGWESVLGSSTSGSMLAGNFGTSRADWKGNDSWVLDTIASSYGVVMLNGVWRSTLEASDSRIPWLAELKKRNPSIKTLLYQPVDRAGDTDMILDQLKAHPEWWLRTDDVHGATVVPWGGRPGGHPMPNYTITACQVASVGVGVSVNVCVSVVFVFVFVLALALLLFFSVIRFFYCIVYFHFTSLIKTHSPCPATHSPPPTE